MAQAFFAAFSRRAAAQGSVAVGAAVAATAAVPASVASCSDDHIGPVHLHWSHHGALSAFDARAVRRGFQVRRRHPCRGVDQVVFCEVLVSERGR
mmetsp:Transcript_3373/g.13001  ORF Transcript_3373/g.13001 Transcript_3373/m.13001 type:complete len:95 (+) Transcript_3373:60-344(+)